MTEKDFRKISWMRLDKVELSNGQTGVVENVAFFTSKVKVQLPQGSEWHSCEDIVEHMNYGGVGINFDNEANVKINALIKRNVQLEKAIRQYKEKGSLRTCLSKVKCLVDKKEFSFDMLEKIFDLLVELSAQLEDVENKLQADAYAKIGDEIEND